MTRREYNGRVKTGAELCLSCIKIILFPLLAATRSHPKKDLSTSKSRRAKGNKMEHTVGNAVQTDIGAAHEQHYLSKSTSIDTSK